MGDNEPLASGEAGVILCKEALIPGGFTDGEALSPSFFYLSQYLFLLYLFVPDFPAQVPPTLDYPALDFLL
ncbi:MAG: hypothetical protein LUG58_06270 [Clostridiales bacterium]|nr:hypothetical protein [Clostridiales bacterium]